MYLAGVLFGEIESDRIAFFYTVAITEAAIDFDNFRNFNLAALGIGRAVFRVFSLAGRHHLTDFLNLAALHEYHVEGEVAMIHPESN